MNQSPTIIVHLEQTYQVKGRSRLSNGGDDDVDEDDDDGDDDNDDKE